MTSARTPARVGRPGRVLTAGLLAGLLALPALAGIGSTGFGGRAPDGGAPLPMAPVAAEPGVAPTEAEAYAQAVLTRAPVEIGAFRTERREVFANPDGTSTAVEHAQPVRMVRDGRWATLDTTLVADGAVVRPRATTLAMRLSGGGDTPLIAVERAGRGLTVDWPGRLPTPVLAGDQATYPEVLPGVDLVVTVRDGGFSHVLVVKTPQAATNPKLTTLTFELATRGMTVRDTADGGLAAVDAASGGVVLEAPAPLMWDSGAPAGTAAPAGVSAAGAGPAAAAAARGPAAPAASTDTDPTRAVPDAARRAPLRVAVGGDRLTLTPDRGMLADPATSWPVYLDPVWESTNNSAWAMVASGYPNQPYWKFSGSQGVGRCPQSSDSSCNNVGVKRQFFALPTPYGGRTILDAKFKITMTRVNNAGQAVTLIRAGSGISSGTTWNNQPAATDWLENQWPSAAQGSCTASNQNVEWTATRAVQDAVTYGWSTTTFEIRALDESTESSWKRFCGNAVLAVRFNRPPDQPAQNTLTMSPGGVCSTGDNPPYVDMPPTLNMVLTDPDNSAAHTEQLYGQVQVDWQRGDGTGVTRTYETVHKGSGAPFQVALPADLPENVVISWQARASDDTVWGPWSATCRFIYDHTQPAAPDIDSPEYLPNDATETTARCAEDTEWRGSVGVYGTFTFDSESTDTVAYRYGFNADPSPATQLTVASGGDPASVTWMPESEGTNFVTVQAVDRAGQTSVATTCMFAVAMRPATAAWGLEETVEATSAADTREANPATRAAGATFGVPGPGCQYRSGACDADRAVRLTGAADSYLATDGRGLVDTSQGFSVAAWVRLADTGRDQVAVSQDGSGEPGFSLGFDAASGRWTFGTPVSDVDSLGRWVVSSADAARTDEWTHLTGVYDPVARTIALTVDGESRTSAPRRSAWRSRGAVQLGRLVAKSGYTAGWAGDLADVQVFDRIVVPAEARTLATLPPVRQGYWPLNDAVDGLSPEYGGGEDMRLNGGAQIYAPDLDDDPAAELPLVGTGHLVLDGVDGSAATPSPIVDTSGSFTVSVRTRVAAVPQRPMVAISQAGTHASSFLVRATPTRWELVLPDTDTDGTSAEVVVNTVIAPTPSTSGQHLAVVYNAFTGEVLLYVDGQLAASAHRVRQSAWSATGGIQLGRALVDGQWTGAFAGVVDDARAYAGAADASTVAMLALPGENPNL